ncbi:RPA-related protein RADX-like isoform X2 [Acanthochromis polyacanthus]|nr:RPA-related protein RADX-like isoform X2 [Acanthochromis polyacanthus]
MTAQLPACTGACRGTDSYRMVSVDVPGPGEDGDGRTAVDWDSLPWFGSSEATAPLVPLRANRSVFLPLWNNVDYSGQVWMEAPPTEEEDDEEEDGEEGRRPTVTVSRLRDSFLSGHHSVTRGAVQHQLIVRIINKSSLMYYGRTDRNCECPYKSVLELCDQTGSVCAVLWNSVCVSWYRHLKPGDIISLRRFRVKQRYQAEPGVIEISVNSRNPAAQISVLPESSVSPEYVPPAVLYSFYNSQQILDQPHDTTCDVIGVLTFVGRSERIRSKDGKGTELVEYRWLRLEDGASDQPIMVKLFATSQPETHLKLHPASVLVGTRLKLVRVSEQMCYLTNSTYTQVYCSGQGHHSQMSYRRLRPVRRFLDWLRTQEDAAVLSRALIGGFFMYPPPPVSMETYMKERRGEPGFLRGAELQTALDRLCYRERRTFCIQATVTVVTYSRQGEDERCLFWTDRSPSLSPSSSSPSTPQSSRPSPSFSSFSPASASSAVSRSTPPTPNRTAGSFKRKLLSTDTPKKRGPWVTLQPEHNTDTVILFEASMEFLQSVNQDDEDDDEDDDASSFVTALSPPTVPTVAMETFPMCYDHTHWEEQAAAVVMGGTTTAGKFNTAIEDYYTLKLRALSDGVLFDAIFLPHAWSSCPCPLQLPHSNTWTSILSHGAFSSHTPPPSPADLIAMAAQLTNQRLVCVLEACHLGGASMELVLSRAFHLAE